MTTKNEMPDYGLPNSIWLDHRVYKLTGRLDVDTFNNIDSGNIAKCFIRYNRAENAVVSVSDEPLHDVVYYGVQNTKHHYIGKDKHGFYVFETSQWAGQPYSGYKENWKDELSLEMKIIERADLTQPFACPDGLSCSGDGSDCVGQYRCEPAGNVGEALGVINKMPCRSELLGGQSYDYILKEEVVAVLKNALSQQPAGLPEYNDDIARAIMVDTEIGAYIAANWGSSGDCFKELYDIIKKAQSRAEQKGGV